mmetsp:Transcript_102554/g.198702  ORF Transcript_102554/g.198702 Transcript_102554/m.198702 type:complete len:483 (+) Transcript_102554:31-1479(+)
MSQGSNTTPDAAAGPRVYVNADTPVSEVCAFVQGLHGQVRNAAVAASDSVCRARTLGSLDQQLRSAAVSLEKTTQGEPIAIKVTPGSESGQIYVTFLPQPGPRLGSEAGMDTRLDNALSLQGEQVVPGEGGWPCWGLGAGGLAGLGQNSLSGTLRATRLGQPLCTTCEITASGTNLSRSFGPCQVSQLGAVTFAGPSGRHSVRLETASRELLPDNGSSEAVLTSPLRSTKSSASYNYLHDGRKDCGTGLGEIRKASVEFSGFLGDVELARAEGIWNFSKRLFSGIGSISAACGVAIPLADSVCAVTPWEDRYFLGGALGGPAARFPGFACQGIGPTDDRRTPSEGSWKEHGDAEDGSQHWPVVAPSADVAAREAMLDHVRGDAMASAMATFQWPLPVAPLPIAGGLRLHGIIFGGVGALVRQVQPSIFQDLADEVRASCGAGIGTPLPGGGFLGITWAHPLMAKTGDKQRNLQLWLSLGLVL